MNGTPGVNLAVIEAVLFLALSCALAIGTVFTQKDFPYAVVISFPVGGSIGSVAGVALRDPAAVPMSVMVVLDALMLLLVVWFFIRGAYHFISAVNMTGKPRLLLAIFNLLAACLAGIISVKLGTTAMEVTQPLAIEDRITSITLLAIFYMMGGVLLIAATAIIGNRINLDIRRRRRPQEDPQNDL